MTAPPRYPRYLSPFVRTRTRLSMTLGLVLVALTAALLPWWLPGGSRPAEAGGSSKATPASTGPKDEAAAAAEAVRTGKKVLVDTATTATSLTWALPSGQYRTRMTATPTRAKDAQGKWADLDNTLKRTAKAPGGLGIAPVNPAVPVRFASGTPAKARADRSFARAEVPGETVLAELELDGHTIAYTWSGALPEPVLDGPRALYSEVLPGVDLLLVAREEGGLAELLIVKTPKAAENPALARVGYGLRSATATFKNDTAAHRVVVQDKAGKEIGSVPTPFAWDSSGRDPELPAGTPNRVAAGTPAEVLKLSGLSGIEPGAKSAQLPLTLAGDGTGAARVELNVAGSDLLSGKGGKDVKYPVFVDPTLNTGWQHWTTAYKPYPNSSFWDGTNFSSGTSDARVGYESQTGGLARSFWRMGFSSSIKGATVTSAAFKVLNNHSWSCDAREFQFYLTGSISSGTTWNAQPSWADQLQKKSFAHGYSSSCPDDYEVFNNSEVKGAAQKAATNGWSNITFGMRATTETSTYTWRKFRATSATLEVDYNTRPAEPTGGSSKPGGACVPGPGGGVTIGKTNITLSASAKDADGNLKSLRFRIWKTGGTVPAGTFVTTNSSGYASLTIPVTDPLLSGITANTTLSWDVMARDAAGADSATVYPPGSEPCRLTVDPSGPSQPIIASDVFLPASSRGDVWATVNFGKTGPITFDSPGAVKFTYAWGGYGTKTVNADASGVATVPDLKPPNAGPNTLQVYAYDNLGNPSKRTDYTTYVPPRDTADGPMDTGGDNIPDLLVLYPDGKLRNCVGIPADPAVEGTGGELYGCQPASYVTADSKIDPPNHWIDAAGTASLIAHYNDAYPGDGSTDLFAVTPDKQFWLYPGDGYGSFNVDKRLKVRLPANAPAPSTWTQMKAIGDITGDKRPDIALRAGTAFWVLSGYSGATFESATLMEGSAWARRDIVNIADMNKDGTPDLLWRNLDNGNMYVRHGKPGTVTGSVDLNSIKLAANSLNGDVAFGTGWTETAVLSAIGIPDVNKDGVPDIWARFGDTGNMKLYYPSTTNTNGPVRTVLGVDWRDMRALG